MKAESEDLAKFKKDYVSIQSNFRAEIEKFKEIEERMKKAEKLNRMFIMNKENKAPVNLNLIFVIDFTQGKYKNSISKK